MTQKVQKFTLSLSTTHDDVNHEMNPWSLEMLDEITYRTHGIWYIYSKDFDMQLQLHCINSLSRRISDLSFCPLGVDVHVSREPAQIYICWNAWCAAAFRSFFHSCTIKALRTLPVCVRSVTLCTNPIFLKSYSHYYLKLIPGFFFSSLDTKSEEKNVLENQWFGFRFWLKNFIHNRFSNVTYINIMRNCHCIYTIPRSIV